MLAAFGGRVIGTVAATTVLALLPQDRMALMFGALVLLGVAMSVSGLRLHPRRSVLVCAGAMSAIMGTIASIGGPPMALVYQDAQGPRLRATMSSFFWIGTVMSLVALRLVGRFGEDEIRLTLLMLPAVMLGLFTSRLASAVVDRGYTRIAVLWLATAAGLAVIVRQLV